jgi:DNA polymerase III epsilon subunit-like protein
MFKLMSVCLTPPPPRARLQEDLVGCPSFADVAQEWREFLEGCDLAGYNAKKFDVPMIRWAL